MDKKWFLYILRCADDTLYTGITDDIPRRMAQHNAGKGAKYTRGRGPVELLYQEEFMNRGEASRREYQVHRMTRREKLELVARNPAYAVTAIREKEDLK